MLNGIIAGARITTWTTVVAMDTTTAGTAMVMGNVVMQTVTVVMVTGATMTGVTVIVTGTTMIADTAPVETAPAMVAAVGTGMETGMVAVMTEDTVMIGMADVGMTIVDMKAADTKAVDTRAGGMIAEATARGTGYALMHRLLHFLLRELLNS